MYSYGAGSPGTYSGLGILSGSAYSAAGSPGGFRGGVYSAAGSPGGYGEEAKAEGGGSSWADIINATMAAGASIFQMQTQYKLQKQAQHQAERDRAAQLELAKTQQMYLSAGVKPAAGSHVTVPASGGMGRMLAIGGVLAVGGAVLYAMRKRRR